MKVLYIHQYFRTPAEPGSTRSYWLSKRLVETECQVTMLTSRNFQEHFIERIVIDGINVIYIKNYYSNNMNIITRVISFIKFMFFSTIIALKEKDVKLVFATSTPLTIGFPALILKWFKRKRYIFEVRDLWPEVPIQMGRLNNLLLRKFSLWFEKIIYLNAEHIVALSPGMHYRILEKGVPVEKITMIPNMSKIDKFYNRKQNFKIAGKFGINTKKFNLIYFGAMGLSNGLEYIVDAARILKEKDVFDVHFIFLGTGSKEVELKTKCKKYKLNNVSFLGNQPMDIVSEVVNLCDCSIISFANIPILRTNSPNKLFDSLSAGKPIVVNSCGWTKDLIEQKNCGAYVDPEEPNDLVNLLIDWKNNPTLMNQMGENSRKLAETKYDKSILSKEFVRIIMQYV